MTRIEEQLHGAFEAQVTELPPVRDPAGTAIARAGVVRRRRTAVVVVAAAVAAIGLAAGVGLAGVRDDSRPAPPAKHREPPPVELIAGDTLYTTDGKAIRLPGSRGDYPVVVRVPVGWLYLDEGRPALIGTDGKVTARVGGKNDRGAVERLVVSPDGRWVAWRHGFQERLVAARVTSDGFTDVRTVAADVQPVIWAGNRLVLSLSGELPRYDSWDPAAGAFVPEWGKPQILNLYGASSDGRYVYGYEGDGVGEPCLSEFDLDRGLAQGRRTCRGDLGDVIGGRWMITASGFVDITTVFDTKPRTLTGCDFADSAGYAAQSPTSVVVHTMSGGLTRCTIRGDQVKAEPLDTSHVPKGEYALVPRLGG